ARGRHRGETHVATLPDYPDPDAISCALAYRLMAGRYDIDVDILYECRVSHQEYLALVQALEIEMTRFSDTLPLDRYDGAVFLDNQGTTTRLTERLERARVPALAVFDLHAPQGVLRPQFADIRPVVASATYPISYLLRGSV